MSSFEDAVGDAIVEASADLSDVTEVPPVERDEVSEGFTNRIVEASAPTDVQYAREQESQTPTPSLSDDDVRETMATLRQVVEDPAELRSFVEHNPQYLDLVGGESKGLGDAARRIATLETLRRGHEAQEALAWEEQSQAVDAAQELYEDGSALDALNAMAATGDPEAFQGLAEEVAETEPESLMLFQQAQQHAQRQAQNLAFVEQQVRAQQQHAATEQAWTAELAGFLEANPDAARHTRGIEEMIVRSGLENVQLGEIPAVMGNALRNAKHVARIDALQRFRDAIVNSGELGSGGEPLVDPKDQAAGAGLTPLVADNQGVLRHPLDGRFLRPQLTAAQVGDGIVAATGDPVTELFDSWRESWREADEAA